MAGPPPRAQQAQGELMDGNRRRVEGFLLGGRGAEGGASSLHRLLPWRRVRERLPREARATGATGALLSTWEAQALHRPWCLGWGHCGSKGESHSNEPAVVVGSLPSELPPGRSLKPQPLSWWRLGGGEEGCAAGAGASGCRAALVSSTRHSPRTPSLKGQRAGVHSQGTRQLEPAMATAGGSCRTRRSLWAQTCGEADSTLHPSPPS